MAVAAAPPLEGGAAENDLVRPNAAAKYVHVHGETAFSLRWRVPIIRTGVYRAVVESFGQPGISSRHNLIIVGTGEGTVLALSAADGNEVWRNEVGVPFETAAAVVQGSHGSEIALVGARDGLLMAFDVLHGKLLWKTNIEGDMRAAPQVVGDRAIVTTASNKVVALSLEEGNVLWTQGRAATAALTVEGHARAAVRDNRVYACFSDGYVSAFDLEHGTLVWARPLSLRGGSFVDSDGDPFLAGGRLFVSSYSDGIYALDPADGQTIWNRPAAAVTTLAQHGDTLLAGSADGYVWGLSQDDGHLRFRTKVVEGPISRMEVQKNLVVFTAGPSGLVALRARDGHPVQATALGGRAAGDPVWVKDILAFTSSSGYVYAWTYAER